MLWVSKLKEGARNVIKDHPASVSTFFLSFFIYGIFCYSSSLKFPNLLQDIFTVIRYFLLSVTAAFFLCEANFSYKRSVGKIESLRELNKSFVYIIVMVVGIILSLVFALYRVKFFVGNSARILGLSMYDSEELFLRFFYVYLAICLCSGVFFLYKKSGLTFENYAVKGFLGIMKGYLAYMVILLGALCILFVFTALIKQISIFEFVMSVITGLMAYTMVVMALSKPGEKISRFGNIMMGYVFPGILAVAFLIVYVYILKILVTWTFPSNEAFTIVTALFAAGACIWTMALGCTDGGLLKAMKLFPLLFIPFIFIQIMCLFMRIHQYGLTQSRYLGVVLIIFEILYEGYYIYLFKKDKGLGGILFPVLIIFSLVILLVPGVNMFASVTRSQKKIVNNVVSELSSNLTVDSKSLARAKSAFNEIESGGGLEGNLYIQKLYAKYGKENVEQYLSREGENADESNKYFYAENDRNSIDVAGFKTMSEVDFYQFSGEIDTANVELKGRNGEYLGVTLDLSALIRDMEELYEEYESNEKLGVLIESPISFPDDSCLYISYISVERNEEGVITDLNLRGYYLK